MEKNNEKKSSAGTIVSAILAIIVCAMLGLFMVDYFRKDDQLEKLRKREKERNEATEKQLNEVRKLVDIYTQTAKSNIPSVTPEPAVITKTTDSLETSGKDGDTKTKVEKVTVVRDGIITETDQQRIRKNIARNVADNLEPILNKIDGEQRLTNEELSKILNKLTDLLEKETKKRIELQKQQAEIQKRQAELWKEQSDLHTKKAAELKELHEKYRDELAQERINYIKLKRELTETREIVAQLRVFAGQIGEKYIDAMQDDSVLGAIANGAVVPVKVLKNTLTFDLFQARDKHDAKEKIMKKIAEITAEYHNVEPADKDMVKPKSTILE